LAGKRFCASGRAPAPAVRRWDSSHFRKVFLFFRRAKASLAARSGRASAQFGHVFAKFVTNAFTVYWEDRWDARGKRFKPDEVSCAHRTEAFGTVFIVTNLDNGKKIDCPVRDRGPFARGRVLDFSLGAARKIGCDGICRVTVRRAGYE
jgi:hypothetical protein